MASEERSVGREQIRDKAGDGREGVDAGLALAYCPNCSEKLLSRQCKMICTRCGYFLSCSDYY